jgi:hypothetical protein
MRTLTVLLLITALAAPATAQSVFGSGGLQCQNWTANRPRKWQHLGDMDWLMGYASGVNRGRGAGSRMLGDAMRAEGDRFVTGFCAQNPQVPIFEAADAWIKAIDGQ